MNWYHVRVEFYSRDTDDCFVDHNIACADSIGEAADKVMEDYPDVDVEKVEIWQDFDNNGSQSFLLDSHKKEND